MDGLVVREVVWLVWELGIFLFVLVCFLNTDVGSEKCNVGNPYIYSETFIYIIDLWNILYGKKRINQNSLKR